MFNTSKKKRILFATGHKRAAKRAYKQEQARPMRQITDKLRRRNKRHSYGAKKTQKNASRVER